MQQIVYPTAMNNLAAFLTGAHSVGSWCMDGRRRRCENAAEDRKWLPSTFTLFIYLFFSLGAEPHSSAYDCPRLGEQVHFARGAKQKVGGVTGGSALASEAEPAGVDGLAPGSRAQRGNKRVEESQEQVFSVREVVAVPVAEGLAKCLHLGYFCHPFPPFLCSLAWLRHASSPEALLQSFPKLRCPALRSPDACQTFTSSHTIFG